MLGKTIELCFKSSIQHSTMWLDVFFCYSAGVGRSGTFIALDSLLKQAELEGKVNVYSYVTSMREQRCNMVQTLVSFDITPTKLSHHGWSFWRCVMEI